MAATTYELDPNGTIQAEYDAQRDVALDEAKANYDKAYGTAEKSYNDAMAGYDPNTPDSFVSKQVDNANESLNLTLQEIEQNKANTKKDYVREQSGAYVDWQQQSNKYGANAEKMASAGLNNTGFSESSQVSMYNTYQNRVAVARESHERAKIEYENQMSQARLANDTLLAEIYTEAYKQRTALSLEWVQYSNALLDNYTNQKESIKDTYWNRYLNKMNSILAEKQMQDRLVDDYEESPAGNAMIQKPANNGAQIEGGYEVNTPYYQGNKNPDCAKYGTFSNGYQPKGISGHGKLTATGDTITIETQTLKGNENTVVQTVWKASDGSLWYWEGRQNKYIQIAGSTSWKTKLGSKLKQEHSLN